MIEDHFDHAYELEAKLDGKKGKEKIYEEVKAIANLANICFIRQKETKGLGHAVLCGKSFIGDEPFAVLYGDDVIISDDPVTGQLCRAYEKYGCGTVGVKEVSREDVKKYCSLDVTPLEGNVMQVHNIVEKPTEEQIMSCYAILGRVILPPEAFRMIEETPYDAKSGELYLSDAMVNLAKAGKLTAVDFNGVRYDMGNKLGILKANCEVALKHEEVGEEFKAYLKELVKTF